MNPDLIFEFCTLHSSLVQFAPQTFLWRQQTGHGCQCAEVGDLTSVTTETSQEKTKKKLLKSLGWNS
jgi:hypothetical protein